MTLVDIDERPDEGGEVPPLFPPRLMHCMRRIVFLGLACAPAGWLAWGVHCFVLALWLHASAFALAASLHLLVAWSLWRT